MNVEKRSSFGRLDQKGGDSFSSGIKIGVLIAMVQKCANLNATNMMRHSVEEEVAFQTGIESENRSCFGVAALSETTNNERMTTRLLQDCPRQKLKANVVNRNPILVVIFTSLQIKPRFQNSGRHHAGFTMLE